MHPWPRQTLARERSTTNTGHHHTSIDAGELTGGTDVEGFSSRSRSRPNQLGQVHLSIKQIMFDLDSLQSAENSRNSAVKSTNHVQSNLDRAVSQRAGMGDINGLFR